MLGLGAAAAAQRSRARSIAWAAGLAALALHFALVEHRFLRAAPAQRSARTLRLVHADITNTGPGVRALYERELERLDPDVAILSIPVPAAELWKLAGEVQPARTPVASWPFLVLSRLPVLEARPIIADGRVSAAVFRLDATAALGRPLTIYALDLPSNPRLSRADIARRARAMLDGVDAAPPDVVVGDLNMTRSGAALRLLFPGLAHAFDQGGIGYGASFPRAWPLYHIDHALIGPALRAARYEVHDPGFGRHRMQIVEIEAAPPGP